MSRVLIAGCGDVGGELARRLLADGHEVYGLRRRAHLLPAGVRPVAADLQDPGSLRAVPDGLDAVCYVAAADGRSPDAYRGAYVDGPRNLLRAAARRGTLGRVLYTSSTRVYPQHAGEWVDEDSPTGGDDYARILLEGEAVVRAAAAAAVVVRLAGIYGPGRTRLVDRVRAGEPCSAVCTNRIHRDDCAGLLRHLLRLEGPRPLYLGADHEPATQCEVMRWIAGRLGLPAPASTATDRSASGKRCRNSRVLSSGYAFEHRSFRDGYAALLAGAAGQNVARRTPAP